MSLVSDVAYLHQELCRMSHLLKGDLKEVEKLRGLVVSFLEKYNKGGSL